MVCDRLATNSSGRLPPILRIMDASLKNAINELNKKEENRPKKGVKRGYALLYSEHCLAYVDYKEKNIITGEYPLFKYYPNIPGFQE
jgi:hypothetical protein